MSQRWSLSIFCSGGAQWTHITRYGLCAVLQNIMKTIIITVKWNWYIHCSSQSLWHIFCVTHPELLDVWLNVSENGSEWSPTVWQSDNCVIFFFFSGAICFTVCNILIALYHILLLIIFFLLSHYITFIVVKLYTSPMCGTVKGFKNKLSSALSRFQHVCCLLEGWCLSHNAEFWKPFRICEAEENASWNRRLMAAYSPNLHAVSQEM